MQRCIMNWLPAVNHGSNRRPEAAVYRTKFFGTRTVLIAAFGLFVSVIAAAAQTRLSQPVRTETSGLIIDTGSVCFAFNVEIASTPAQQQRGLQGRHRMAADSGMLFPVDPPAPMSMWMANTPIPLDIIFIGTKGDIAGIFEQAVPLSRKPISSPTPVRGVLEVRGGTVTRLGIKTGDRVIHPALGLDH